MASLFSKMCAVLLGVVLTGYSAWTNWTHHGDILPVLAAITAAASLSMMDTAWLDRQRVRSVLLGLIGVSAALFSGSAVLERIADGQSAKLHAAKSSNLPRTEGKQALEEATQAKVRADALADAECKSGFGKRCRDLLVLATDAGNKVSGVRAALVGAGAQQEENPAGKVIASVLGVSPATYQLVNAMGLPIWLEVAAPILVAYGLSRGRNAPTPAQPQQPAAVQARKPWHTPKGKVPRKIAP